jgi:hypothetical protein
MTADVTSQSYMSGLGCPQKGQCEYDDAFGLSDTYPQPAQAQEPGARVYTMGGGTGALPVTGSTAEAVWEDYNMLASLIENTGPNLNPVRMQAAASSLGTRGGGTTGMAERGFAANDWNWTQDVEVGYWNKTQTSRYNGQPGSFLPVEGTRFTGTFPALSEPPVPVNRP